MTKTVNLACVVGARPNFMKMAPLLRALNATGKAKCTLIHTGQHYDKALSDVFFEQLDIPKPDVSLDVGSGTQAGQTAKILERIEPVLEAGGANGKPFDYLVVVGDVNSTMAAAIAAAKLGIKVAHVEAGLRSFDRAMPEEINRMVTDSISDLLLVSDPIGIEHLKREGHPDSAIHLVGNLMIDTLMHSLEKSKATSVLEQTGLHAGDYGVVTLHRPSNVDDKETLSNILKVLRKVSDELPIVFPIHPRTLARIESFGLHSLLAEAPGITVMPPQGYLEFLSLTSNSKVIVTDSGGLQEESTVMSIPCLTMRENTERPITVTEGSSTLVGNDADLLDQQLQLVLSGKYDVGHCPKEWDGKAAGRIAEILVG
ncbi:non-hydrolyzing UDP-N-acetylglucosamine 2-epimerase [Novipirellula artificiosorum]|uniref:UDP-2,3-diacetamido-2,3-dideoxy-D-glucuronate 2-epimerase n=1 Tax=Novipirellula artificiosorum TaxID=2528016 RepID=A0A5C6DBP1_9BACT|nr:UDP-N-acetylglucosamine 2-epimerase (non-hydrolyzing) [Novipirellula artificiosorum]TWU32616.1 UDP-2,3-diacetamido-2,3-dideoxy-D-glucuronate 2-epimerase [Novipirellula artificiosorum]